jgi:uncharacterized membrane protein
VKEKIMTSIPLHPALVHIPLALAFLLPLLSLGFAWAVWTGRCRPRAWLTIVVLQAMLLGAGWFALNAGGKEEDRVEAVVPKAAIETHEEYAEQFMWVTAITLGLGALVLVARRPVPMRALTAATVLGTFVVAGAAIRVGHSGGELVYVHNAGAAYSQTQGKKATDARPNTGETRPAAPRHDED